MHSDQTVDYYVVLNEVVLAPVYHDPLRTTHYDIAIHQTVAGIVIKVDTTVAVTSPEFIKPVNIRDMIVSDNVSASLRVRLSRLLHPAVDRTVIVRFKTYVVDQVVLHDIATKWGVGQIDAMMGYVLNMVMRDGIAIAHSREDTCYILIQHPTVMYVVIGDSVEEGLLKGSAR